MEGSISFHISYFKFQIPWKRPGFSLAEIIIVLGVVGIMISGLLPLYLNTITAGKSASYYSTAYKFADSKIEEYRNANFDSLQNESISIGTLPGGNLETIVSNQVDGASEPDMRKIDLTVSWNFKKPQSIRIVTYIYRGGL